MCRTINCIHRQSGLPKSLLEALFGQFPHPEQDAELDHGSFLTKAIESVELDARISEIALAILKRTPPEGERLVALEAMKPSDPGKVGVVTLVTYELPSGAYRVVGTDHLTQEVVEHTTPNQHGLEGLTEAVRHEISKIATETVRAEGEPEAEPAAQQ